MIEVKNLTKRYGQEVVVDDVSFRVEPGVVTGFLGPNGAGKSTTMRMILGLDHPTSGSATIDGLRYADHPCPLRVAGALLDAKAVHKGRTARDHLRVIAATHGIPHRQVDTALDLTGLTAVAKKRVGTFSLGMGQRLGIAAALLGQPGTVILDEPVNGLDPEGVAWVRQLARNLAQENRAVLLSSHLMAEMSQTADYLVVLGKGRVLRGGWMADILADATGTRVRIRSVDLDRFLPLLRQERVAVISSDETTATVEGVTPEQLAALASRHGVALHELTRVEASLEDVFFALTSDAVEYRAADNGVSR